MSDAGRDRALEDALAEYIARIEEGAAPDAASFAARFPDVREELLEAIEMFARADEALPDVRDALPARIDGWHVRGFVGQGAFGRVLRVRRDGAPPDESDRALKLVRDGLAMHPRALERFRRECNALRELDAPGIVSFRDHGVFGGCPYVVTDLVHGPSLAERIEDARSAASRRDPPPAEDPRRVAKWVASLARSVHALHARGLLHRDLKPANVILDTDSDSPCLIDLGLVGGEAVATLTGSGDILGTPAYMAPEQARAEACTVQSDVYGLGGILYELLTLAPPRSGRSSGSAAEEMRVRRERRPRSIDPRIPKELAAICERALAFAPRWRHPSALALAEDLEHFARSGRAKSRGKSLVQHAHEAWIFHRTAIVALASAALVAALFAGIYLRGRAQLARERAAMQSARTTLEAALEARRLAEGRDARAAAYPAELELHGALEACARALFAGEREDCIDRANAIVYGARLEGLRAERAAWTRGMAALCGGVASLERPGRTREQDALKLLQIAQRSLPGSKLALRELVRAQRFLGKLREAAASGALLERRGDLRPHDWHELAKLGCALQDDALAERALRAIEESGEAPSASMLNTAAIYASQRGDMKKAHAYYERIRALDPGYALARFNQAHSLDKECRLREARDAYSATIALDPTHGAAIASLAWLHAGSGRDNCEKCAAEFRAHPELHDPARALALCLQAIQATQGRSRQVLASVVATAKRLGEREAVGASLRELQARPGLSDRRLSRITRAIQDLDR